MPDAGQQLLDLELLGRSGGQAVGASALQVELIDHQLRYRHLAAPQFVKQRHRLGDAQRLGYRHRNKLRPRRIVHQLFGQMQRGLPLAHKLIEAVRSCIPAEDPPHIPALGQQHLQHAQPAPDQFGHGQQPQGMAAGRRIHHDAVVLPSLHPGGDLEQRHQLVQTGQREIQKLIDVLIVQEGAGGGDLAQHAAILLTEPGQALLSVQFEHLQIAGGRVAGQTVPHRVRRVGGNQQQRMLRRRCGKAQRGGRGAGGLAHSPLAAEQQKLKA